jgi:hypothetical protein
MEIQNYLNNSYELFRKRYFERQWILFHPFSPFPFSPGGKVPLLLRLWGKAGKGVIAILVVIF